MVFNNSNDECDKIKLKTRAEFVYYLFKVLRRFSEGHDFLNNFLCWLNYFTVLGFS